MVSFYGTKENSEAKYRSEQIEELFSFLYELRAKNYEEHARDVLLKKFFKLNITRKGLRKADIDSYGNDAQVILSFLLTSDGKIDRRSLVNPASVIYDSNELDFNLVLQHW